MSEDPDSFERWLERRGDWKTAIAVLVIAALAAYGFFAIMDRVAPCKVSDGCYATDDPDDP